MKIQLLTLMFISLFIACSNNDLPDTVQTDTGLYFPPVGETEWETISMQALAWNTNELAHLFDYLASHNTRAFIVLKEGKIVIEEYWGNQIINDAPFDSNSQWYWASAGKTLTALLVGIAQQEGHLNINDKTSTYLGEGWTSMDLEKENLITIKNQLTMTTGLDYEVPDLDCTSALCLEYRSDAGTQWFYHNAPYTLLEQVVSNASGIDYNLYTDQKIESIIGMNGQWISLDDNNIYWSTARDMAKFGLLILNRGTWKDSPILSDENYFDQMLNTSQELNPSYGYLWWLNGKNSIILPSLPTSFDIELSSHAPDDLIAAVGKNGQYIDVVPSQNLVVIRIGETPDDALVPIAFHNEMWQKLSLVIK